MRVALIDFNKEINLENLQKEINKNYKENIFFDIFQEDLEEAEYCIEIRQYDLIIIDFKKENFKRYYNILGLLSKQYKLDYNLVLFVKDKNQSQYKSFIDRKNEIYKNVNLEIKEEIPTLNSIISYIESYFETIPKIIDIKIDYDNKILNLKTNTNEVVSLKINKSIDFQVLVYFIRHYGEVININSILSAITEEPEYMNNSPIESSISSIRKIFATYLNLNPIKALKRIGYQFSIK